MKPALSRYNPVSLEQLRNADKHVFVELASLTSGGLGIRPDGTFPVETAMPLILLSPDFLHLLMQIPQSGSGQLSGVKDAGAKSQGKGSKRTSRSRSRRRKITEQHEKNRVANASRNKGKQGKSKSKGKGKGVPYDATTETGKTEAGENICYDFNLGGCDKTDAGSKCAKGWHVCWKKGCGKSHTSAQHAKAMV